ncbi:MAG: hypothetical protein GY725_07735 [bacterium]|nr:hypothetical protein [bacterium]
MVRQLTLITADGFVRRTLHQALDRHTEAVSDRGDRICVELVGDLLELNRATVMANGREITCELQRATAHTRFAYVSSAEFVDCRAPD